MSRLRFVLTISCLAFGVLALGFSAQAFAKRGDKDAVGRITSVTIRGVNIEVTGWTKGGPLWLGCTFNPDTYKADDRKPKRVKGKFKVKYTVPVMSNSPDPDVPYAVALWRWKVSKSECKQGERGGPCKYCRKNGCHLEDRIDRRSGEWSPPRR